MLIVPWGWWHQHILHIRGWCRIFSVCGLFLQGLRTWSHLFWLVFVPPHHIYSVLRDMVHVVGVLISHVGIFAIVLWFSLEWRYLNFVFVFPCHNSTLVWCRSIIPLYSLQIFYIIFQCGNNMVYVCLVYLFHAKIIYNKGEVNGAGDVWP